jgi:hypothetical protein
MFTWRRIVVADTRTMELKKPPKGGFGRAKR